MNALTMSPPDDLDDGPDERLPGRPRLRLLTRVTVPLLAVLIAAGGFLGGIEVQKGHGSSASAASAGTGGFARGGGFAAGRSGAAARGAFPGRGGFGGAAGAGSSGGATTGTISSISGRTIDLKESSGTTVAVTVTSVTALKKDLSVSRNEIRPGDEVTVEGVTGSGGSIKASSISDSGHAS